MMGEPKYCSQNSAFKLIPQSSYLPTFTANRCNSGSLSAGHGSSCKKNNVDNTYNGGYNHLNNNSSSLHLLNLQQVFCNRFRSNNISKKTLVAGREENCKQTTSLLSIHRESLGQLKAVKSESNNINLLDYTTGSSSTSSGNSSGIEYKRRHCCTLPSITTTMTDTTTSDYSNGDSLENRPESSINYHYLYANPSSNQLDENYNNDNSKNENACTDQIKNSQSASQLLFRKDQSGLQKQKRSTAVVEKEKHSAVRRVSSFTFSPEGSLVKHNKRGNAVCASSFSTVAPQRKFTLGPLGKTLSYLKTKVDTAISTSTLYPTKEECRLWQDSFEALISNKYGCYLFRQFVEQEFSAENLEFWLACEEYKKMKEGKKSTFLKAQFIYNTYIKEGANKEVNLDSVTKASTKAIIENGIKADSFNLAQNKIEQLMSKDSYQRFLKSEQYLQILNGTITNNGNLSDGGSDSKNVIMRTNSTRDSPTTRRACAARRHTCVPEQSETVAIQTVADKVNQNILCKKEIYQKTDV